MSFSDAIMNIEYILALEKCCEESVLPPSKASHNMTDETCRLAQIKKVLEALHEDD